MTDFDDNNNNNVFDQDDALDFIIYSEIEKDGMKDGIKDDTKDRQDKTEPEGKGGCLGLVLLVLVPLPVMHWLVSNI